MPMQAKDVPPGEMFLVQSGVFDNGGVREVLYLRDPEGQTRYPNNIRIARLLTVQGYPGSEPRHRWVPAGGICRDPGEMDGRTPVVPVSASHWPVEGDAAVWDLKRRDP